MQKQISFKTKGMQRDLSVSAFNSEYAYENKNVRVMPTDESTLLSLINEKGNKKSSIAGVGDYIKGIPIGQALVNDELVIFTAGNDKDSLYTNIEGEELEIDNITANELTTDIDYPFDDRIYKLWFNNGTLTGKRLFRGDLGFNYKHPIETISFYENTDIRKVYWTDGLNQPRVINVAATDDIMSRWNNDTFNFVRKLLMKEEIVIEKNIVTNGSFAPGVLQYAFTYFTKYGQESNIFYTSPLYYTSYNNRGASPEDKVANSFTIKISKVDPNFDYLRVYSILRTSKDATPIVKRVVDLKIGESTQSNSLKAKAAPMAVAATNDDTYTGNLDKFGNTMKVTNIGEPIRQIDYNNDGFYVQGAAAYGKYLFQAYIAGKYIDVIDLTTNTRIATLTTNIPFNFTEYQGNVLSFGPYRPAGSNFPYLYYSCEYNNSPKILAFKINSPLSIPASSTWTCELIQTTYLPECDGGNPQSEEIGYKPEFQHYFQNGCVDAENRCIWVSGYTVNSYKDSSNDNKLVYRKYDLHNNFDVKEVYYSFNDVKDSFTLPFKTRTQGMVIKNNILYQCFGYYDNGAYSGFIDGIDLSKKSIIHSYPFPKEQLKDLGELLKSPYIYLDNLYLSATCYNWRYYTLWQVQFKENDSSGGGGGVIVPPTPPDPVEPPDPDPDIPIPDDSPSNYNMYYIDDGLHGDIIDPTELLYVGGEEVVFGTMTQKDNTLFLGDIKIKRRILGDLNIPSLNTTVKNYFKGKNVELSSKYLMPPKPKGYYPYSSQLDKNSYEIKTFKYLEYYRLGIQAQHYTGKWSEPIWINDVQNTGEPKSVFWTSQKINLPVFKYSINDSNIIKTLTDNGYVNIRPVIVYPTINDREVICQGILCPTVYNVADRYGNTPFAQSSWFTRPNAPFDYTKAFKYKQDTSGEYGGDWTALGTSIGDPSLYSRAGIMSNDKTTVKYNNVDYAIQPVNKGAWAVFKHNAAIPANDKRNAEIQCISTTGIPYVARYGGTLSSWVAENAENYFVDQSIFTFHSPDIEFNDEVRSIDTSKLKLRIVGMVPITSFASDIDIETSTPVNNFYESPDLPMGFYKEPIGVENNFTTTTISGATKYGDSHFGWRGLISGAFWFDDLTGYKNVHNSKKLSTGFVVYPWHRNGSLNNTKYAVDGYKSAMLSKKRLSNLRFSYKTFYFRKEEIWNAYVKDDAKRTGISGVTIFDSNEVSTVRIPAPLNSNLSDLNYYGNVDKLLTVPRIGAKKDGYPIMTTGTNDTDNKNAHILFTGSYIPVNSEYTDQTTGIDPVRIKYKSTPHAVIALNFGKNGEQRILPTLYDSDPSSPGSTNKWSINGASVKISTNLAYLFWDKNKSIESISQDVLNVSVSKPINTISSPQHGWLWLGELYNDNVQNRFGGKTEEAIENNVWLPCGKAVSLKDASSVTITWEEGDTYFQRYDHIKTYPFSLEDQNQVTDIVSFMCETRVNLDGRYDRNRGQTSNFAITPSNFNLLNNAYSQSNNFFNYRTINSDKLNLDTFHNSVTWSKSKTIGELIDSWTNVTLATTLDLDGDKGPVRALRRFNNNILAFQDRGISQILYNENMQISSTEGVPIEIANSGKVNGKRYITDKIGCTNKWSICETSSGIYFIDDITKGIFLFNGQLNNISDKFGFHSWINKASKNVSIWNPVDFDSFVTYYDKVNGDVFFISRDECLAFSEPLGQFSSFYSYEKMPYFTNLEDRGVALNVEGTGTLYRPWLHNEGDYNMFFGVYQPFYTTVIANPDMQADKVFNNLEFRSDSWDMNGNLLNTTFDTLTVWNEYQQGTSTLNNILGRPSNLKKKFRIWRANIPRAKANGRDRMRNPWLYIKLSMEKENTNKTILHDMMVHYFE